MSPVSCCYCCSVVQSCLTLCDPVDRSTPGHPVLHHLPEFAQVHVNCTGDAIQPSHPLTPSSPSALSLSPLFFKWATFCIFSSVQFKSLSRVWLFVTSWTTARQASLVHHQLPEFTQTHAHRVGDAIQLSHPLSSPSPPASNPSHLPSSKWLGQGRYLLILWWILGLGQVFYWVELCGKVRVQRELPRYFL